MGRKASKEIQSLTEKTMKENSKLSFNELKDKISEYSREYYLSKIKIKAIETIIQLKRQGIIP